MVLLSKLCSPPPFSLTEKIIEGLPCQTSKILFFSIASCCFGGLGGRRNHWAAEGEHRSQPCRCPKLHSHSSCQVKPHPRGVPSGLSHHINLLNFFSLNALVGWSGHSVTLLEAKWTISYSWPIVFMVVDENVSKFMGMDEMVRNG